MTPCYNIVVESVC